MKRIVFVVFFIVAFLIGGVMMMSVRDPLAPKEEKVTVKVEKDKSGKTTGITNIMEIINPAIITSDDPLDLTTIKTCKQLLYFVMHSGLDVVQRIPRQVLTNEKCKKKLAKYSNGIEVSYLLKCLDKKDLYTDPRCKKNMVLFRAFAVNQKFLKDKKFVAKNKLFKSDSALIHSLLWDMEVKDSTKLKPLEENIKLIDKLLKRHPGLSALSKAKVINLVKKDIYHGKKTLDDLIFKTLETNNLLGSDDRDIDELRLLLVLHKTIFYDKKEIKEWIEAFFLTHQEYNRTYYYRAFHSLVIEKDLKSAKEWVESGIQLSEDTDQVLTTLKAKLDSLTTVPNNPRKLFPMYFNFTFLQ